MTTLRVGVGSGNPVKRRAVELALGSAADDDLPSDPTGVAVESVPVDSGVSEQPTGHAETIAGAENRAAAVLDAEPRGGAGAPDDGATYDLGVGVEGGVAGFDGADGRYLIMWAAVTDGERVGRAAGPSFALLADIAARIDDDEGSRRERDILPGLNAEASPTRGIRVGRFQSENAESFICPVLGLVSRWTVALSQALPSCGESLHPGSQRTLSPHGSTRPAMFAAALISAWNFETWQSSCGHTNSDR